MKSSFKLSIKSSIVILISVVILAVLACQLVFSVFFSKSYYIYIKQNEIQDLFYHIKSVYSDDMETLFNDINTRGYDYNIIIIDENGAFVSNRMVTARAARIERFRFNETDSFADFEYEPKASVNITQFNDADAENIMLLGKFDYGGETLYIIIQMPVQSIEESVSVISAANAAISICILALGIICAVIFSSRFSKPIRHIQSVAHSVSELDFTARANEEPAILELKNLAVSVNAMSDKLNGLISNLQEKNKRLSRDINYQKKLDAMRRTFVANVSHELKTPLCLLQLYCENLKNASLEIDRGYYLDTIVGEVENMDVMVKSMLNLSLVENGLTETDFKRFDISEFTRRLTQKMLPLFNGTEHEINIESGLYIDGDTQYLEQAFKNYITNAVSHVSENGKIVISLCRIGDDIRFSVYNTGKGIPEDDLPQIWESFYKTDKSRTRQNGEIHAGLGLYIVKTITEAHGGTYGANNADGGVEFWIELKGC